MFSLLFLSPDHDDLLIAELWDAGTTGIVEEDGGIRAFFDDPTQIQRFAQYNPEIREEQPVDWAQATRDAWPPMTVGRRFFLTAPWSEEPTPPGRLRLPIYPGMACGTGRHPATQLALEAIERHVRPGDAVADIGTGSGILSAAAALIGAARVVGCDVDPEAVKIAGERVKLPMFVGSAAAIRSSWADVVIANIDAATIEDLAREFARIRKPDSVLILTGFPEWELPEGFAARETLEKDEWRCLIC
ncbi:MAG TPA: 50S ribosomal protein L11 methyltransferase [Bryobacteraceae bacterium]|nr:50S ribosomal protein L11 methyltransferase [Bryobacteraceae bacterium]